MLMFLFLVQLSHYSYDMDIIGDQVTESFLITTEFAIIVIGICYHPSIGIIILIISLFLPILMVTTEMATLEES